MAEDIGSQLAEFGKTIGGAIAAPAKMRAEAGKERAEFDFKRSQVEPMQLMGGLMRQAFLEKDPAKKAELMSQANQVMNMYAKAKATSDWYGKALATYPEFEPTAPKPMTFDMQYLLEGTTPPPEKPGMIEVFGEKIGAAAASAGGAQGLKKAGAALTGFASKNEESLYKDKLEQWKKENYAKIKERWTSPDSPYNKIHENVLNAALDSLAKDMVDNPKFDISKPYSMPVQYGKLRLRGGDIPLPSEAEKARVMKTGGKGKSKAQSKGGSKYPPEVMAWAEKEAKKFKVSTEEFLKQAEANGMLK